MSSVASRNPFDLLAQEAGDSPAKRGPKDTKNTTAKPKKETTSQASSSQATDKSRTRASETRPRRDYPSRGGIKTVSPRDLLARGDSETGTPFAERSSRGARSARGGRGRGRGGRGGDSMDRHSRTGMYDSTKKINQGWGKPVEGSAPLNPDEPAAQKEEATGDEAKKGEEQVAEEPAEVIKTLDDFKKESAKAAALAAKPARKANEGVTDPKLQGGEVLENTQEEFFSAKNASKSSRKAKARKSKVLVDIEQRFNATRRGGHREDRPSRGRGGRGGSSSNRSAAGGAVNVQDERAFPTLGGR
ncbi:hypothetical protein IWQ62_004554 [Dispira parvispora]|uniref:Hyaluronan/mRNA-binding protein domain-containing protein n=1 Tax=Dispira parvispora TaxID=1520584 RepID=A0A9W8E0J1_9FUNG|nr:hypothetical protein IWQ62_004554 [Dispira parvispora]